MPEMQTIPARHGVATFVPAGQTIKIVNTSGHQVVDTWAFALPHPDVKNGEDQKQGQQEPPKKEELSQQQSQKEEKKEDDKPASTSNNKKNRRKSGMDLPTQEEAEKATKEGLENGDGQQQQQQQPKKSSWSSYVPSVPSIGWSSSKSNGAKQTEQQSEQQGETEKQKNSRTWGSYMPSGKGYTNYIPKSASDTVASFASTHQRDPNKSYVDQLRDFSTTPVGAAGIKAISGSGYGGSLFAGYQAWNAMNAPDAPAMEFLSIPHTRASTKHMVPKVNDLFVSNLREPMLTLVEDASSGTHDTLMAACDPARYRQLGVDHWEEHGSCAENLVLALKELNERAGLKGAKGVGADVTINNVPAPLNLFMNVPWDDEGDISFKSPKTKSGDFVRLRAERDIVVVMSACPQDVTDINNKNIRDAHFLVEGGQGDDSPSRQRSETPRRRPQPRKINSGQRAPSTVATGEMGDDDKSQVGSTPAAKKPVARKTTAPAKRTTQNQAGAAKKPAPVAAAAAPKKKAAGTPANSGEDSAANGSAAAPAEGKPVEKKKPRKLVRKE